MKTNKKSSLLDALKGFVVFVKVTLTETSCGCFLTIMLINGLIGGWSIDYLLGFASVNIPFIGDMLIGLVAGELSIPIAIIAWLLHIFGAI